MINREEIRSILVVKLRNIGDVLLTSPLFSNLRLHLPHAKICALVNSGTEEMLSDNPDLDQVLVYDRTLRQGSPVQRIISEFTLISVIRKERFDLVLNLTEGDRGALVALLSGASKRIGIDSLRRGFLGKDRIFTTLLPPPSPTTHAVDENLRFLEALELEAVNKKVSFHFSQNVHDGVVERLRSHGLEPKGYFQAHVTSRWMFKCMPAATAAMLIDVLTEKSGLPALLTAAPVDKELEYLKMVKQACKTSPVDLGGTLSLKQMGALTSCASFFVGVDSAPMHIAAALNVPVLAVFGPSSATSWGPWDNSLKSNPYEQSRGVQTTARHMVLQSTMPCVPCLRDGCNGSKKSDCLEFPLPVIEKVVSDFVAQKFEPLFDPKENI
jgi:heptosyltransferase-3